MDDFKEVEYLDVDDEVQLEDLGAPDKGSRAFVYRLGEKWLHATRIRPGLIALICTVGLMLMLLLSGSTLLNSMVNASHTTVTTSQENAVCHDITVNSKDINWSVPPSVPTPPDSVTLHLCDTNGFHYMIIPDTSPVVTNSK